MTTLDDIIAGVEDIILRSGNGTTGVETITYDSRRVRRGALFVALRGDRADGHDYIDAAVKSGASAVLVDQNFDGDAGDLGVPVLESKDTRRVLGPLGCHFFENPSRELTVIAITGTNGKTSSSYLLEAIFEYAGHRVGIIGTIEYRWPGQQVSARNTTPDGLILQRTLRQMVDDDVDVVIVEVSSHGLENGRVEGMDFDAALFTNLSRDHVDFHGSIDNYRQAKWRLFETYLPPSGGRQQHTPLAVINTTGDEGKRLYSALKQRSDLSVVTCDFDIESGHDERAHFAGSAVHVTLEGVSMVVDELDGRRYGVQAGVPGRFHAENMLGAIAVGRRLGVSVQDIVEGLAQTGGIPGRMERVENGETGPAVFVDYAHSPDALEKALATLRPLTPGQLWIVFGCGGDRDRSKRAPMGEVAARLADRVMVTSDNPRTEDPQRIIDEVVAGLKRSEETQRHRPVVWEKNTDREEAIVDAILRARPEDVILVAGKGHETYQECNGRRRSFDDRAVARQALRRRGEL